MAMSSRLRYVDASDLEGSMLDFGDMEVHNTAGEKIGEVDGFIVDTSRDRLVYVVIDSGGWFTGRTYLLPAGLVSLNREGGAHGVLVTSLDKERLSGYPAFDADRFASFSPDESRHYEETLVGTWVPESRSVIERESDWTYDSWNAYRQPDWWHAPTRRETASTTAARTYVPPARDRATEPAEAVVARDEAEYDPSERAQPGDVIGIETGGETTSLADTAEDEDKRRVAAEKSVRDVEDRE